MELQQIKYFRVIARTENISRAAEQLFIAQPSLSQMLKRLEEEIGMPLFDRNGKKIVLNGAGKIFLKYADEVCQALENAESELREYGGAEIMDVNISQNHAPYFSKLSIRLGSEAGFGCQQPVTRIRCAAVGGTDRYCYAEGSHTC